MLTIIKTAVITISDKGSKGERVDKSGEVIKEMIKEFDGELVEYNIIPDEREIISKELKIIADSDKADLILTTGGTGFAKRDVTPEATMDIVEKDVPGIPEEIRADTMKITEMAALSRAKAGIRKESLIINLPGSPKAVRECLESIIKIIPHAIDILKGEVTEHN